MKVHRPSEIPAQPVNAPLFTGGPVTRQTLLTPEASKDFNLGIVNFSAGARNKMHTHSSDQVLFVTAGKGIIATETEQQVIVPGDVFGREALAWRDARLGVLSHRLDGERQHEDASRAISRRAAGDERPTPPGGT